jgi:hypothetical protein
MGTLAGDLETADSFTGGNGTTIEEVSLDDLVQ